MRNVQDLLGGVMRRVSRRRKKRRRVRRKRRRSYRGQESINTH